jgi:hypothetical protein
MATPMQEAEYHMCRAEPSGFDPVTLAPASGVHRLDYKPEY